MEQIFETVKEIEKYISMFLSEDADTAESMMIENAAAALEKAVEKNCSGKKRRITILCGCGNNGADGYTLCRRLAGSCKLNVVQVQSPKSLHCVKSYNSLKAVFENSSSEINFYDLRLMQNQTSPEKVMSHSDVIVDCIFGTGFHGIVDESIQKLFSAVNNSEAFKIACDIPSGLDSTSENISGFSSEDKKKYVFNADLTVSMGGHKIGLFSDAAKDFTGRIKSVPIGVSEELFKSAAKKICAEKQIYLLDKADINYPDRKEQNVHKGKFGHACVIAGNKAGAAILSASAALKIGAGLSSISTDSESDFEHFKIPASIMADREIAGNVNSFVLGPGFGREGNIRQHLDLISRRNCEGKKLSVVFDADSFYYKDVLDFISKNSTSENPVKVVLTPHPKEFSNLLKLSSIGDFSVKEVSDRRLELTSNFIEKFPGIVLVLKGANSFVCHNKNTYICNTGNSALAKGGSGDVLSGIIAGLLAQNYSALDAAISGVLIHAEAGSKHSKNYSLTPELLLENI